MEKAGTTISVAQHCHEAIRFELVLYHSLTRCLLSSNSFEWKILRQCRRRVVPPTTDAWDPSVVLLIRLAMGDGWTPRARQRFQLVSKHLILHRNLHCWKLMSVYWEKVIRLLFLRDTDHNDSAGSLGQREYYNKRLVGLSFRTSADPSRLQAQKRSKLLYEIKSSRASTEMMWAATARRFNIVCSGPISLKFACVFL